MTHEAKHFVTLTQMSDPAAGEARSRHDAAQQDGNVLLHEGATFCRYTDVWATPPRFSLHSKRVATSDRWNVLLGHYKVAIRAIVGSSRDKSIATFLPPGCLVANSALVEGAPEKRSNADALALVGLLNATVFSWLLSFYADFNVNLFALKYLPVPALSLYPILTHNALRLCCNHVGYKPLWREQLGHEWRERSTRLHWPVIPGDDARWALRAAMDAVVAHAYGLERTQYAHVLDSFNHSNYPDAPVLCLSAFDELTAIGFDQFTKKYDPYWDVPLVTALPKEGPCHDAQ